MIEFTDYSNRAEWLKGRKKSIGASEIAIACGESARTPNELWQEKHGDTDGQDLSGNERVHYGTEAEKYLRGLFSLKHEKEYKVEYYPFRVYRNTDEPFLTCTLDGELTRLSDGAKGGWECKTVLVQSRRTLEEWDNQIPQKYYCQVLQQMYCAGLEFVILNAELRFTDYNADIREYLIERKNVEDDIKWVVEQGKKMKDYILSGKKPPLTLKL